MDVTPHSADVLSEGFAGTVESVAGRSSGRTIAAARRTLARSGRFSLRDILPFVGPAFIASVAYIDPGNFATNVQAGSAFGYLLLWVILASNLMAILLQSLSAKLGIASGRNLPELCRIYLPRHMSRGLWIIAEIGAMATDLAEFLGAAVGLNLLLHVPMVIAGVITGMATFAILLLQRYGFRPLEAVITGLVGIIAGSYLIELVLARPAPAPILYHTLVPMVSGPGSLVLAVGILGATVMPHVVFLHSALTQSRVRPQSERESRRLFRFEQIDIWIALGLAGLVNGAMIVMAAAVFHGTGHTTVADLGTAFRTLAPLLGGGASTLFGLALLVSGLASSAVGTMAGQVIMEGFLGWHVPIWVRRLITMLPAMVVLGIGVDPTTTLVISQVVLSFVLPFAIVPLMYFTSKRDIMRGLVNGRLAQTLGWAVAALVTALNILLLYQTFGGHM